MRTEFLLTVASLSIKMEFLEFCKKFRFQTTRFHTRLSNICSLSGLQASTQQVGGHLVLV